MRTLRISRFEPRQILVQEKALADEPTRVVSQVYEKPHRSSDLEGSDRIDHIALEFLIIVVLKGSYE